MRDTHQRASRRARHGCGLAPSLTVWMFLLGLLAFSGSAQVVRVGFYENAPELFTNASGEEDGFFPELLAVIAEAEGWQLQYIRGTWIENLDRLAAGEIDLLPDVAYSEARAQVYGFSQETLFTNWGAIYIQPPTEIMGLPDLEGHRIAVMRGSLHTDGDEGIMPLLDRFNVRSDFVEVDDYESVFEAIHDGRAEAGVVNRFFGLLRADAYGLHATSILFDPIELRFAYPLGSADGAEIADALDRAIREMKADVSSVYYTSLSTHLLGEDFARIGDSQGWWWAIVLSVGAAGIAFLLLVASRIRQRALNKRLVESETRSEAFFDFAAVGLAAADIDRHRMTHVNGPFADILGYDTDELVGRNLDEIIHDHDLESLRTQMHRLQEGKQERSVSELRCRHRNGTIVWVELTLSMGRTAGRRSRFWILAMADRTRQKRAERELAESEQRLRDVMRSAGDWVWEVDAEGRYTFVSEEVRDVLGYEPEELLGIMVFEHMPQNEATRMKEIWQKIAAGQAPFAGMETWTCEKGGRTVCLLSSGSPIFDAEGTFIGYRGSNANITSFKRAEAALQAERDRAQQYLDIAGVIFVVLDVEGRVELINTMGVTVLGRPEDEIIGVDWVACCVPEDDRERIRAGFRDLLSGKTEPAEYVENEILTASGERRCIFWHNTVLRDEKGTPTGVLSSGQDITEIKESQRSLAESEARFRGLLESAADAMIILDDRGRILLVNKRAEKMFGYHRDELNGREIEVLIPERFSRHPSLCEAYRREPFPRQMGEGPELWAVRKDKTEFRVEISLSSTEVSNRLVVMVAVRDVTEQVEAELALRESEERLMEAQAIAHLGHWNFDFERSELRWSDEVYRIFEVDRTTYQPTYDAFLERLPSDDREIVQAAWSQALEGLPYDIEHRILAGRDIKWVRERARIDFSEDGRPLQCLGTVADITDQKHVEMELERHRAHLAELVDERTVALQTAVEAANAASFRYDILTNTVEHDQRWYKIVGLKEGEFDGTYASWKQMIHPEDLARIEAVARTAMESNTDSLGYEYRIVRPNGEIRFIESRARILRDSQGTPISTVGLDIDITKRREADAAIREREAFLQTIIDNMPIDFFSVDRQYRYTMQSPSSRAAMGEVVGRTIDEVDVPEAQREEWKEQHRRALSGESFRVESELQTAEGKRRTYLTQLAPVRVGNEIIASIANSMDITDRKHAEMELAEAKAIAERAAKDARRFRMMADASGLGIGISTLDGVIEYINPTLLSFIGEPNVEAVIGKDWREYYDERSQQVFRSTVLPTLMSEGRWQGELRLMARDGTARTTKENLFLISDENGRPAYIADLIADLTEQKAAEARLRKLSQAIEDSPVSVVITDINGNIEYVNPKFCRLTGYAEDEVLGRNPRILKAGDHASSFYRDLWNTILSGQEWRGELCNQKKSGELFWELASISPIRDENGSITHFVAVKEDITTRKYADWELEQATRDAQAASQAKSEFLANMSHELRTPLNAVIGFSEILEDETFGDLNEKQAQYIGNILASGRHLLDLINDILDLSKIEAGKMSLELEDVNVSRWIFESLIFVQEKAMRHNIKLQTQVSPQANDLMVRADERKLKQILFNLLSNAVKFTPDGGTVNIEADVDGDDVVIRVTDTGIGIRPEEVNLVFEEFEQLDSSYARSHQGTGLGLALTKRLVELHGGRIEVVSEGEDKGSTFAVRLPLGASMS